MAQVKVHWNVTLGRVIAPSMTWSSLRTDRFLRVGLLGSAVLMGGKFLPKLNISRRPIAYKYREGNVKRTLKRELKVFETVNDQAMGFVGRCSGLAELEGCSRAVFRLVTSYCRYTWILDVPDVCLRRVGV